LRILVIIGKTGREKIMIISIHQPQYMPWLGYFDKMARADVFVLLDDVQFKKNEWQNRNQIKTAQGRQWITVPVLYRFPERINEVKINNSVLWQKKQKHAIEINYGKTPFFKKCTYFLDAVFSQKWETIDKLNVFVVEEIARILGISTKIICSSQLDITSKKNQRLVDICRKFNADTYIAGRGGEQYMDAVLFEQAGIKLEFQQYPHPQYPQLYGAFASHLSVIDLLFNCGEKSLDIIRGCA